jgi:hypothetical protein
MNAVARRAYGHARARARRAAMLSHPVVTAMAGAPTVTGLPGWHDLGPRDDGSVTLELAYSRLVEDYLVMRRAYPEAREGLRALLQLHELENLKLLWRAAVSGAAFADWRGSWRPLGVLQTIARESFGGAPSLASLPEALRTTPYGELAANTVRSHGRDIAAAELAIDRFGTHELVSAHDRLPGCEQSARRLLQTVIVRRDAAIDERACTAVGRPVQGRLNDSRPGLAALAGRIFAREPFSLAVPLALVLLREQDVQWILALSEVRARHLAPAEARRAMEAASRGQ